VRPRDELRHRIAERIDAMIDAGLRAEVDRLVASGYGPGDPGMRAIGYREFFDETGAIRPSSQDRTIAGEIVRDTRRYARRQATFFRQIPDVREIAADDVGAIASIVDAIPDANDP
jgi:tRNA dimethylallyltransferase